MKLLFLFLVQSAFALEDRTLSKERLFQIACERGLISFYMEYGNGSKSNKDFLIGAKTVCEDAVKSVTAWPKISSPSETGCSVAINMMASNNTGIPDVGFLWAKYCANADFYKGGK